MARRFSRLDWAIKVNGGSSGGALLMYENFKKGTSAYERTAPPSSDKSAYVLTPFTIELGGTALFSTLVMERAITRLAGVGLAIADLNIAVPTGPQAGEAVHGGIKPARIQAAQGVAGTQQTSKITGLKYSKSTQSALSCPFGASSGTDKMGERFKTIKTKSQTANAKNSISMTPERLVFGS